MRRCGSTSTAMRIPQMLSTASRTARSQCGVPARTSGGRGRTEARREEVGEITLSNMLYEWTLHDLGHVRQIAELVRARNTWPAPVRSGSPIN